MKNNNLQVTTRRRSRRAEESVPLKAPHLMESFNVPQDRGWDTKESSSAVLRIRSQETATHDNIFLIEGTIEVVLSTEPTERGGRRWDNEKKHCCSCWSIDAAVLFAKR